MNKVVLMGRLTRDPEVRYTKTNNTMVASFSLAVNRRFAAAGEERQADFINIVAWNKTGEFCSKYFKKGQQVGVIGRIQTRTWDDENGQKRYATEVIAEEAYFADSKRDGDTSGFENTFGATMANNTEFQVDSSDDDLPF
ncbi:MAG: single-stranded DNA-binding protein [Clostridia bacterium]|nr:single-stranded DNA-binding protein [Clostridia bacterium]